MLEYVGTRIKKKHNKINDATRENKTEVTSQRRNTIMIQRHDQTIQAH